MNKDSDTFITNNERAFVIKVRLWRSGGYCKCLHSKRFVPAFPAAQALREGAGTRLDGRTPYEYRKARLQVGWTKDVGLCIERPFSFLAEHACHPGPLPVIACMHQIGCLHTDAVFGLKWCKGN
jgi:hypothetical protein